MDSFYKEYDEKDKELIEKNEFNFDHPGEILWLVSNNNYEIAVGARNIKLQLSSPDCC